MSQPLLRFSSIATFLLISLVFTAQWVLAAEDYYNDSKPWQEWDELVQKFHEDFDVQAFHALKKGLCPTREKHHMMRRL